MGISDHLTCLLKYLYTGQESTVRIEHEKTDWLQTGKEVRQAQAFACAQNNLSRARPLGDVEAGLPNAKMNGLECSRKHKHPLAVQLVQAGFTPKKSDTGLPKHRKSVWMYGSREYHTE